MPRNAVGETEWIYQDDWFHPTADSALTDPMCGTTQLRVGFWDDTGEIAEITVTDSSDSIIYADSGSIPNGSVLLDISGFTRLSTLMKVEEKLCLYTYKLSKVAV